VQGQLRQAALSCLITTECAHCRRPLHIEIDSALRFRVQEADAQPLVYAPMMDEKRKATEPSIIDFF
jgi:hypothetical protein